MSKAPPAIYADGSAPQLILVGVTVLSLIAVVVTLFLVRSAWRNRDRTYVYAAGAFWAIAPPVWFWLEYELIYRTWGDADAFEYFKYGQQVVVSIWAGVTLFLFAVSQSDHFKASAAGGGTTAPGGE